MTMSLSTGLVLPVALIAASLSAPSAGATQPTAGEIAWMRRWVNGSFGPAGTTASPARTAPFSFVYGGRPSAELLPKWRFAEQVERLDSQRTRRTQTYTDPDSGLEVRCAIVQYADYPTVEWTVYLGNTGAADTPIVEGLQALDATLRRSRGGEFLLHHSVGSPTQPNDYQPLETVLEPGSQTLFGGAGGRPTIFHMSYFNLEWDGGGVILAVGWPGQWLSEFARDGSESLRIRAGQELTHFVLHPGEEVRTPLIVFQFWQGGDWIRAQNIWRKWFIAHSLRKPGGKLPPTQWCGASDTGMMVNATEENQKTFVDAYLARGLHPDFWWMDAGWYPCNGDWTRTGTWEPDPARFPRGLRPVTDYLHARGIRAILWFEPERVREGTWLATTHPEWLLGDGTDRLLNLGDPEAWGWLVDHVDRVLTESAIDIYRQDFNFDPLPFWRAADAPDRQGMAEIRYVTGLLAYWDELLRRHPDMLYDNCASGGRRNDLESMRRGVPYTKSDYADDPVGVQGETYGISLWLPYFAATWESSDDAYLCRSRLAQTVGACLTIDDPGHFRELPRRLDEWRQTVRHYWGDFYPLTPYSLAQGVWIAWQFHTPETGTGVVQAFRRAKCAQPEVRLRLRGLEATARYRLTDLDHRDAPVWMTGKELMEDGLQVEVTDRPGAAIVVYRRVP